MNTYPTNHRLVFDKNEPWLLKVYHAEDLIETLEEGTFPLRISYLEEGSWGLELNAEPQDENVARELRSDDMWDHDPENDLEGFGVLMKETVPIGLGTVDVRDYGTVDVLTWDLSTASVILELTGLGLKVSSTHAPNESSVEAP